MQKLAVFLQSLDDDNNASNGIVINQNIKNAIELDGNLSDKTEIQIRTEITKPTIGKNLIDITSALTHLVEFTKTKDTTIQSAFKRGNTVIDMDTKLSSSKWLQWQDNSESNTTTVKNQYDYGTRGAENYCSALVLDGLDDWRAPSREELLSIVDSTKTGAKIKSAFEYTSASQYATGEDGGNDNIEGMYFIDFSNGSQGINSVYETSNDDDYKVRCVRGGNISQLAPTQFIFNDNLNGELNTNYESNSVVINGLTQYKGTNVSVVGGEYSIDGSAWTNITGEIFNGQNIKVRGTTSSAIGIRQNVTLTIGGIADTFTVVKPLPKNGDIVTDTTTGLLWQDDTNADTNRLNWDDAVSYCNNLTLGSYSDWRLPNIDEAVTISDLSSANIKAGFENLAERGYYWTTTVGAYDWRLGAYYFSDYNNRSIGSNKSNLKPFRCVRGGN